MGSRHLHPLGQIGARRTLASPLWSVLLHVAYHPETLALGREFDDRRVHASNLLASIALERDLVSRENASLSADLGVGVAAMRFGDRGPTDRLFPDATTDLLVPLGVSLRLRPWGGRSAAALELTLRENLIYLERYDPAGLDRGRELTHSPMITAGASLRLGSPPR